jgi:hypothetical protein
MVWVLPASAGAATPERGSKTKEVVTRREEGGLADAIALVQRVTVAQDRTVITYRAAGEKRPRHLVIDYAEVASEMGASPGGAGLYWATLALACLGLAMRLTRLNQACVPELAQQRIPPADR